ncbi:MAG TPA: maleylpyruvate isomerase family mycothiol-dependent enzyme [Candidatus Dormibacteraeota bacterium]
MDSNLSRLELSRDWYLEAVDAVPDDRWKAPSLCAEWTAGHVVAHVTTGDQLFQGLIMDAIGKDRRGLDLPVDFADRRRRFEELTTKDATTLKTAAHHAADGCVETIKEAVENSPSTMVTVPFGTVPVTTARALRLNEYIIHGHDLEPAIGKARPIPDWFVDRALADAITMLSRLHQRSPHKGKGARFHVHRTDGEGEWMVIAENGEAKVESGHGTGDAAFRGPGHQLYWVLMGRGRPDELGVEVHGDPALAGAFKEWFPGP